MADDPKVVDSDDIAAASVIVQNYVYNRLNFSFIEFYQTNLGKAVESLEKRMKRLDLTRKGGLNTLKAEIDKELKVIDDALQYLEADGAAVAELQYEAINRVMLKAVDAIGAVRPDIPIDFDRLPAAQIKRIITTSEPMILEDVAGKVAYFPRERVDGINLTLRRKFKDAVNLGFVDGQGTEQIVTQMRNVAGDVTRHNAMALVRTWANEVIQRTNTEAEKPFVKAGLIKGYIWISVLDDRTTYGCAALNGKIKPNREDFPPIPRHWNCRSTIVPHTELDDKTADRSFVLWDRRTVHHRDGTNTTKFTPPKSGGRVGERKFKIPKNSSKRTLNDEFLRWQDEKNPSYIIDYFGPERYKIWHKNKDLVMADFVDEDFQKLTVKQIKQNLGI